MWELQSRRIYKIRLGCWHGTRTTHQVTILIESIWITNARWPAEHWTTFRAPSHHGRSYFRCWRTDGHCRSSSSLADLWILRNPMFIAMSLAMSLAMSVAMSCKLRFDDQVTRTATPDLRGFSWCIADRCGCVCGIRRRSECPILLEHVRGARWNRLPVFPCLAFSTNKSFVFVQISATSAIIMYFLYALHSG